MSIEQDLRTKLTAAIKAKDLRTANIIRMLNTKVMERRTAKGFQGEVDDALYLEVIGAYQKAMAKAVAEYEALGERGKEQADELRFEVEFCAQYLPKQLSEDEVRAAVRAAISALGTKDPKMVGRVVGSVMKDHKGRVDAGVVKEIATAELSS